ncbi:YihY/virulence factor BrkB family protein [Umezawaea sp. Da 62-37]|uniref:YihY/virulence factor BrkB family protein n=1 Tax=Umezawaea sp. Da 62-37 TaxID=3075927 RepID=UPI0028F7069B|nr:YihY/virulence factor BrkB family protein [Umezawaea sp. Da 62-37]WNV87601.1 YihY/virulence factor BrkB family protein [Umezawaea sp. Da 62-37]
MTALRSHIRGVLTHFSAALRGRDLTLWAAGLTFFSVLAIVPMLLLLVRGAALFIGDAVVLDHARRLGDALPEAHDSTTQLVALAQAAVDAKWTTLLTALVPASMYGEGLRRALVQTTGTRPTGFTGWAGRLGFLPVLLVGPVLLALPLAVVPWVGPLYEAGGWSTVLGIVVSFHVDWVPISLIVFLIIRFTGPPAFTTRAALLAGFVIGAVLTGFLHGFVVFLAIPLDWSIPFGGLTVAGVVAALALWLFVLHVIFLMAYRVALSSHQVYLARRSGRDSADDDAPSPPTESAK